MQNTNRNLFAVLAAAIVVGGAAFLLYTSQTSAPITAPANTSATSTAANTAAVSTNTNKPSLGGATVVVGSNIQELIAQARLQKNAGNYTGAIATLNKALAISPGDVVVNNNIGDLYMFFAKDYVKAEASYKKIIAVDPKYLDAYRHLLELYTTTSYKPSNTAAADIVAKALVALPNAYDLQVVLAHWYRDTHDYSRATATYKAAIANAKAQGFTKIVADLETELARIPQ